MIEKRLIINADDFGLHSAINEGIQKAHQEGHLTSTTLIASGNAFDEAVRIAKDCPELSVGVHLTLVGSLPPISAPEKIPSLLTEKRVFRDSHIPFIRDWTKRQIQKEQIYLEWCAQIEKIRQAGIEISHIDSHQHLHVLPGLSDLLLKVAKEYNIPAVRIPKEPYSFYGADSSNMARIVARNGLTFCSKMAEKKWQPALAMPDHFFGMLAGGQMTLDCWKKLIPILPEGVSEVMTHPGRSNSELGAFFPWKYHWQEELAALQSEELTEWLTKYSIKLTNYRSLKSPKNPTESTSS